MAIDGASLTPPKESVKSGPVLPDTIFWFLKHLDVGLQGLTSVLTFQAMLGSTAQFDYNDFTLNRRAKKGAG